MRSFSFRFDACLSASDGRHLGGLRSTLVFYWVRLTKECRVPQSKKMKVGHSGSMVLEMVKNSGKWQFADATRTNLLG